MDSEIHNLKKSFRIHQSVIEIRLLDSAIQKSTIYANFASGTPLLSRMQHDSLSD